MISTSLHLVDLIEISTQGYAPAHPAINDSDEGSGNTLQLSSQATGKNKKSTASEYIKPRYQKERNMVFLLLQTSYKFKMLRSRLTKWLLSAFGLVVLFAVFTIGFRQSLPNDSSNSELPSPDGIGLLAHDVVFDPSMVGLKPFPPSMVLKPFLPSAHASWAPLPNGDSQVSVLKNSLLICEGVVVDSYAEPRGPEGGKVLWFTVNRVQINKILALTPAESENVIAKTQSVNSEAVLEITDDERQMLTINVVQTGAISDGGNPLNIIEDAPLLEIGESYTLFLSEFDENSYIPVGGRFGVAKNEGGVLHFTNAQAEEMMVLFEGEAQDATIDAIASLKQYFPMQIEINSSDVGVIDFVSDIQD